MTKKKPWSHLTGHKFTHLTVIYPVPEKAHRTNHIIWRCSCTCGKFTNVSESDLHSKKVTSCGCLPPLTHRGRWYDETRYIHGMSGTAEYRAWASMRQRCNNKGNPNYKWYGGRGIKVCKEWSSFSGFFKYMGRKPHPNMSIDRIDVDGNYEPGNCRWATAKQQTDNRRCSKNANI